MEAHDLASRMRAIVLTGSREASVWFEKYRKSDRAWDDLFAVLGGGVPIDAAAKDAVNLLAAQTLCFKVSRGPLLPEPRIPRLEGQKSHHTEPTERHRSTVFGQSVLQRLMSFTVTAAATSSTTGCSRPRCPQ